MVSSNLGARIAQCRFGVHTPGSLFDQRWARFDQLSGPKGGGVVGAQGLWHNTRISSFVADSAAGGMSIKPDLMQEMEVEAKEVVLVLLVCLAMRSRGMGQ